jgi:hypothetical protein
MFTLDLDKLTPEQRAMVPPSLSSTAKKNRWGTATSFA